MVTGFYKGPPPTVTVTVCGQAGAGKSTVAEVIKQALALAGVSVAIDEIRPVNLAENLGVRLESLKAHGLHVVIETQQTRRRD